VLYYEKGSDNDGDQAERSSEKDAEVVKGETFPKGCLLRDCTQAHISRCSACPPVELVTHPTRRLSLSAYYCKPPFRDGDVGQGLRRFRR
jgi:hypothetical protein